MAAVGQAYAQNGGHEPANNGEFSAARYAFLFKPGTYAVDVPVGYYTQVLGLGEVPGDVVFDSERGVYSEAGNQADTSGALSTFWRGAENFRTTARVMLWASSQASPLRSALVDGDLQLSQFVEGVGMGYASGGFLGNVRVEGLTQAASQQQYFMRNAAIIGDMTGGVWNLVFVGTLGAPASHCSRSSGMAGTVTVDATPVIAEKPFISVDGASYVLNVPGVQRGRVGPDFGRGRQVGFERVYVATAERDSAETINAQLRSGLDVVLSPGIYGLEAPLVLERDDQVLLGLGLATLVAERGTAAVRVGNASGVRVAGVLLQAGAEPTEALLDWGDASFPGDPANPGFLHDVYVRVGGDNDPSQQEVRAGIMARVASGHVVGDNLWLWRADHGVAGPTEGGANPCENGLVVTGDNVTMYGLSVEHAMQDLVRWTGDNGSVYFYQSEFPYDVDSSYGEAGYVGYRVGDNVISHQALGVGVYHFFRDADVEVATAIAVPEWLENSFESPFTVGLGGRGRVLRVLNDRGAATEGARTEVQWSCERGPDVPPNPPTSSTVSATTTTAPVTTNTATATSMSTTILTVTSSTGTTTITGTSATTATATATTASTTTTTWTQTKTATRTSTTVTTTTYTVTTTRTSTTTPEAALWIRLLGASADQGPSGGRGLLGLLLTALCLQLCLACLVCTACCLRSRKVGHVGEGLARPLPTESPPRRFRSGADLDMTFDRSLVLSPEPAEPRTQTLSSMASRSQSFLNRLSAYRQGVGRQGASSTRLSSTPGRGRAARELSVSSLDISGISNSPGALVSPHGPSSPLGA